MDWFRMYSEFASDPKVQSMSESMQRRLVMVLCLRSSNTLVTLQDEEICFALRISNEELAETKALFMRKGFITEGWEISNWDKRQFVSDSSAPRVARYRARQKEEAKKAGNVTVAPPDTEQIQNRTDTEQKKKDAPAAPKPRKPAKTSLPADFSISQAVRQWAASKGFDRLEEHFESFIRKARANGYTYVDWGQALQNAIADDWAKLRVGQARASPSGQLSKAGQVTARNAQQWLEDNDAS